MKGESDSSVFQVSRSQIVVRGLANRCPNCGGKTLFQSGRWFDLSRRCPNCGLEFERDEGFFLGSMSINYGMTLILCLTPILILWVVGVLPVAWAIGLALSGALLFPILFYRSSRSWWLMSYYFFLPHHLPANRSFRPVAGDENT